MTELLYTGLESQEDIICQLLPLLKLERDIQFWILLQQLDEFIWNLLQKFDRSFVFKSSLVVLKIKREERKNLNSYYLDELGNINLMRGVMEDVANDMANKLNTVTGLVKDKERQTLSILAKMNAAIHELSSQVADLNAARLDTQTRGMQTGSMILRDQGVQTKLMFAPPSVQMVRLKPLIRGH